MIKKKFKYKKVKRREEEKVTHEGTCVKKQWSVIGIVEHAFGF